MLIEVQNCSVCGGEVERQPQGTQRQQVAELVPELVEVWEYERPLYRCPACEWQGYPALQLGCQEGFSYGGRLSSNDAERGLRPVVMHRKVSVGARGDWGAQLVAIMFSCLASMRRQGKNAVDHLFELVAASGRSPPVLLPG